MTALEKAVSELVAETEDFNDASSYAGDIADDLGCPIGLVVAEIKRQFAKAE